jgi:hypothetical protein
MIVRGYLPRRALPLNSFSVNTRNRGGRTAHGWFINIFGKEEPLVAARRGHPFTPDHALEGAVARGRFVDTSRLPCRNELNRDEHQSLAPFVPRDVHQMGRLENS